MISRPSRPAVFGAMSLTLLLGCSLSRSDTDVREQEYEGGQLITAEEIRQSGASTGWDVLRRFGDHLNFSDHERGPVRVTRRGRESIHLNESPLLIIDGVRVSSFRVLTSLPARDISSMRILTASEATVRHGMFAASGAIIVETFHPDPTGTER